jgi:hypothetical protein
MSRAEAITCITQIRSRLAPIKERLLDIEARLAAAKVADIERQARVSLREFTSRLLDKLGPSTANYGKVVRRTIGDQRDGHPTRQVQTRQ